MLMTAVCKYQLGRGCSKFYNFSVRFSVLFYIAALPPIECFSGGRGGGGIAF